MRRSVVRRGAGALTAPKPRVRTGQTSQLCEDAIMAAKKAADSKKPAAAPAAKAGDLNAQFEAAGERAKKLKERPDNDTLLRLYALYKQGAEGDVKGEKP